MAISEVTLLKTTTTLTTHLTRARVAQVHTPIRVPEALEVQAALDHTTTTLLSPAVENDEAQKTKDQKKSQMCSQETSQCPTQQFSTPALEDSNSQQMKVKSEKAFKSEF